MSGLVVAFLVAVFVVAVALLLFMALVMVGAALALLNDRVERREIEGQRHRQHADVRDIATGRPHLRLVVDNVGDEVQRNVFPTGDAA